MNDRYNHVLQLVKIGVLSYREICLGDTSMKRASYDHSNLQKVLNKEFLEQELVIKKRKKSEIAKQFNISVDILRAYCERFGIVKKQDSNYGSNLDIKDKLYGVLTVRHRCGRDKNGVLLWLCECECGKTTKARQNALVRGYTTSCGCKGNRKNYEHIKMYEDIPLTFLYRLKTQAKNRSIKFDISIEDLWNLYIKQDRKCVYTGLEISFMHRDSNSNSFYKQTVSVDRIDNSKGYTIDNIQLVHKIINMIKNSLSHEEFICLCNIVSYIHKRSKEEFLHYTYSKSCYSRRTSANRMIDNFIEDEKRDEV